MKTLALLTLLQVVCTDNPYGPTYEGYTDCVDYGEMHRESVREIYRQEREWDRQMREMEEREREQFPWKYRGYNYE